jgi:long-subunit fatty acid transport protein
MRFLHCFVILFCITVECFAITDEVMWEQFTFNFASPGARANAMGRAFVGLADDATAAQSNPAGLVLLSRPEVSFENKTTGFASPRPAAANSLRTGETVDFGETINSPAFASFVYPTRNLRVALFRQEFLNYREEFRLEKRIVPETEVTLFQVDGDIKLKGVNYGAAAAYHFSTKLFAGFSARISQLSVESEQEREIRTGPNTRIDGNSSEFTFAIGIIYNPVRKVSFGVVYERNGKYHFEETYQRRDGGFDPAYSLVVKVPDRYAVGTAIRPTEGLTIVADIVKVEYSQLSDDFTIIFNEHSQPDDFHIKDATEIHLGAEEIFFVDSTAIAVRGGFFTNPPHRLRYSGKELAAIAAFNFGEDSSAASFTIGGGVSVSNQTQIDAAYIFSDTFNEFSASFVLRF